MTFPRIMIEFTVYLYKLVIIKICYLYIDLYNLFKFLFIYKERIFDWNKD